MVRVLLYGYATGVYSSRKIERRSNEDVAFRYLSGDQHPDHATLAEFRKRHLDALSGLFTQALLLCAEAGLVHKHPSVVFLIASICRIVWRLLNVTWLTLMRMRSINSPDAKRRLAAVPDVSAKQSFAPLCRH